MFKRYLTLLGTLALLTTASSTTLADTTQYTCSQIQTNYNGAITRFYNAVSTAYQYASTFGCTATNNGSFSLSSHHDYQDLCNALSTALVVYNNGDHTFPTLKGNYDAIKEIVDDSKHGSPDGMKGYMVPMEEQKDSAHHRVKMWDANNTNNPNNQPCREYKGCDLGSCQD